MISMIVAMTKNRVIGNNGVIPWKIKGEQKRFKELTTGNIVIMGRRTFEEIGKPLPNRTTVVVSNTKKFEYENCITVTSLIEALSLYTDQELYIAGGSQLYKEALPYTDVLYVTEIDLDVEGDTYFPEFDESLYSKTIDEIHEDEITWRYVTYTKL